MRVVLDTNVWVSGLMLPGSVPGRLLDAAFSGSLRLVSSLEMHGELARVLRYLHIRQRIRLDEVSLTRFLAELRFMVEEVELKGPRLRVPRDRGDDMVLATYIAGQADYLITGDDDLLCLRPRFAVITPTEFAGEFLR